jgi:uncharacterized peroxidase-related enzyme
LLAWKKLLNDTNNQLTNTLYHQSYTFKAQSVNVQFALQSHQSTEILMPNIKPLELNEVSAPVAATLNAVKAKLGVLPNMFRTWAHSPVALDAYMKLSGAAGEGTLSAKQREQIALAVGEQNACGYCVSAHSVIGGMVGLKPAEIDAARNAVAANPRDIAILELAQAITRERGHLSAGEVASFKSRGLTDADILEVLVNVVLNIFTNYTNHIAATEIDFPVVELKKAA